MSKRGKHRDRRPQAVANRGSEVLTVGWMLMVMTTLICEMVAALAYGYVRQIDRQAGRIELLANMMLFAACIIGLISLVACPVVLRSRRVPPPRSIVLVSLIVALAPLVSMLLLSV